MTDLIKPNYEALKFDLETAISIARAFRRTLNQDSSDLQMSERYFLDFDFTNGHYGPLLDRLIKRWKL
jgi:hypothetical protein